MAPTTQVKRPTHNLPGPNFVYGLEKKKDEEGVRDLAGKWKEHEPGPQKPAGANFVAMNATAVKQGAVTAAEQKTFRQTHDIRVTRKVGESQKAKKDALPSDHDPDFVYGRPSNARLPEELRITGEHGVPIGHLIQGAYADEWKKSVEARQDELKPKKTAVVGSPTKSSILHATAAMQKLSPADKDKEAFKMKKFQNVPPKVDTKQTIPLKRD
eukprot:jgi/Mesvir1/14509/Mv05208-RA.1